MRRQSSGQNLVWRGCTAYALDRSFDDQKAAVRGNNQLVNPPSEFENLSNDQLAALAAQWRARALHGERDANGRAHELERELRRRSGALSTLGAELRAPRRIARPWWAFWRK